MKRHFLLLPITLLSLSLASCGMQESSSDRDSSYVAKSAAQNETMAVSEAKSYDTYDGSAAGSDLITLTRGAKEGQKLVTTVSLDMETRDLDAFLKELNTATTGAEGYFESSSMSGSSYDAIDKSRSASFTARIPEDKLAAYLQQLKGSGNVLSENSYVKDVTLEYTDVESRKHALTAERDRLYELLSQAASTEAILSIQQRIGEIDSQLESYESQLRHFDNSVSYSTVNLYVMEVREFRAAQSDSFLQRVKTGFKNSAYFGVELCTTVLVLLLGLSPIWIPVLILVLLLIHFGKKRREKEAKAREEAKARREAAQAEKEAAAAAENNSASSESK
ncbi:DUF4349 domain-containing protein [Stomatobaculum sp. F0698]|uniref:DUF4349 domain-containing protein n=1 Tax=Stomatobaculum sp. F0698 TaxID=3059030 RepID=UPI00272C9F08|nr:DUF4349 domain-containing protein [Stomatobaculum sp. F0698]WLD87381.1 DUF4349 domain-containing protein [Stomatobaculum sp. F0698]